MNSGAKGKKNIHSGHRDRLRERYVRGGLDVLAEHEVLELILFYALRQGNTNPLAHKLIGQFGSLRALLEKDAGMIANISGLSINTAVLLSLFLPVSRRYELDKWGKKYKLNTLKDAREFAKGLFIGETNEVLYMICLDAENNVVFPVEVARGTIDKAPIYPRVIIEKAIIHGAAYVILAHNHPSGSLMPSARDVDVTRRIAEMLSDIEVIVSDHIIVGGKDGARETISFSERKLLHNM